MLLGEIKILTLSMMYPDASYPIDDSTPEGVENAIFRMKADHNFKGLLEATVGAINRAFSIIEEKGLSFAKCTDRALSLCKRTDDGRVIITPSADFLSLERLLCHKEGKTYACGYEVLENKVYTDTVGDVYTLVYREKIPRIKRVTRDSYEVELPNGLCEAIPYYVMSQLLGREDLQRARDSREQFYSALDRCERRSAPCHQCFQIIYSME